MLEIERQHRVIIILFPFLNHSGSIRYLHRSIEESYWGQLVSNKVANTTNLSRYVDSNKHHVSPGKVILTFSFNAFLNHIPLLHFDLDLNLNHI